MAAYFALSKTPSSSFSCRMFILELDLSFQLGVVISIYSLSKSYSFLIFINEVFTPGLAQTVKLNNFLTETAKPDRTNIEKHKFETPFFKYYIAATYS